MACGYTEDCGEYAVAPMLVASCYPSKCIDDTPICFPCLPRCSKGVVYCCEKKRPRTPRRSYTRCDDDRDDCCERDCREYSDSRYRRSRSPPPPPRQSSSRAPICPTCSQPTCKPVKTKYVIPCYRYEDGRINQPTVLMRRACEVAVGTRVRRKPFAVSSVSIDQTGEVHRYHCEDERGNCCYHFERKKPCSTTHLHHHHMNSGHHLHQGHHLHPYNLHSCDLPQLCHPHQHYQSCRPSQLCTSSPECQFVDCVQAKAAKPHKTCCFYS